MNSCDKSGQEKPDRCFDVAERQAKRREKIENLQLAMQLFDRNLIDKTALVKVASKIEDNDHYCGAQLSLFKRNVICMDNLKHNIRNRVSKMPRSERSMYYLELRDINVITDSELLDNLNFLFEEE